MTPLTEKRKKQPKKVEVEVEVEEQEEEEEEEEDTSAAVAVIMAKMFKYSRDADIPELNIFDTPPTNTSVKCTQYIHLPTKSRLDGVALEWKLNRGDLSYYDLRRLKLHMKCKIVDRDGSPPDPNDTVFPVNHLLRSMWKKVDVYIGGINVTGNQENYHYKSMMKTLLYDVQDIAMKNKISTELFYEDTAGGFDYIKRVDDGGVYNEGAFYRSQIAATGEEFIMEGSLGEDTFELDNYLINGVEMKLKLTRNEGPIVLMTDNPDKKYNIKIEEAIIKLPVVDVGPAIVTGHDAGLKKGGMAQYFLKQSKIQRMNVNAYVTTFNATVHDGTNIPERIIVAFVDQKRYDGDYGKNPFHFHHLNIQSMTLKVNTRSIPPDEEKYDFKRRSFVPALNNLYSIAPNIVISPQSFDKGYSLFAFELTSMDDDSKERLMLQNSGDVELCVKFAEGVPAGYVALIYSEFQSCIQIDSLRKVHYSDLP